MEILNAGLQTTLQGAPFTGHRHLGMPAAGAADCLSLALANFLVGKPQGAVAVEIALTKAAFGFRAPCSIGVVGPAEYIRINGQDRPRHETLTLAAGDTLDIGPGRPGCRTYLALSADLEADRLRDWAVFMAGRSEMVTSSRFPDLRFPKMSPGARPPVCDRIIAMTMYCGSHLVRKLAKRATKY